MALSRIFYEQLCKYVGKDKADKIFPGVILEIDKIRKEREFFNKSEPDNLIGSEKNKQDQH